MKWSKEVIYLSLFIGIHQKQGATQNQMVSGWERYKEEAMKRGLKPMRVYISLKTGMGFCLTEAPSEAKVAQAHQEAGVQTPEEIIEVKILE